MQAPSMVQFVLVSSARLVQESQAALLAHLISSRNIREAQFNK